MPASHHGVGVGFVTLLGGQVLRVATDIGDAAVAEVQQVLDGLAGGLLVIGIDPGDAPVLVGWGMADQHERCAVVLQYTDGIDVEAAAHNYDAVGLARIHDLLDLLDLVLVTFTAAHDQAVAVGVGGFEHAAHYLREEAVVEETFVDVGHDHADGLGALGAERAGDGVGVEAEFTGSGHDALAGGRADAGVAGIHTADGAGVHAGFFGDIADVGHSVTSISATGCIVKLIRGFGGGDYLIVVEL